MAKPAAPKPQAAPSSDWRKSKTFRYAQPFLYGGLAGCTATTCIQPIDMVKVRLQLTGEGGQGQLIRSPVQMAKLILKEEGFLSFYKGLSAAWVRQLTYGTARLGFFRTFSNMLTEEGKPITFGRSFLAGLSAGALGSVVGTPADLVLIRMQADATLPLDQRRNYRNVFHAMLVIFRSEGLLSMWKGNAPTVARAMAMNVGMLTTYDMTKVELTKRYGPGRSTNVASSMFAGFFAAVAALPFDFVKTRIQKQRPSADGTMPYRSMVHCARVVFQKEGPFAFYRGFSTFYIRVAPHAVITLLTLELLNGYAKQWGWQ